MSLETSVIALVPEIRYRLDKKHIDAKQQPIFSDIEVQYCICDCTAEVDAGHMHKNAKMSS